MMDLIGLILFCAAVVLWCLVLITKINSRGDDK